ncbi:hypothetical protein FRC98_06365 [Lujinxingia vulgaris]|uniref:RING-type E3 ubiquitin transferase n=1 Tax=Lujinxingia vulgaris TaxID=2600176 RepID=A0A5C6XGF2_9DELT|nr:LemA family protein [Lujinxingia vulgaris]TXD38503.1 hypothetical protein FRC98_06365 [Lujinxingia vulgaris]
MKRVFMVIAALAIALAGYLLLDFSFEKLQDARRISRIPLSKTQGVLPGETYVSGAARARPGQPLLRSPDTSTDCLYYHYTIEREEKDSDGDTRWVLFDSSTEMSDFVLVDDTGEIRVSPNLPSDVHVGVSHQREHGQFRYTEYRIDPGDRLVVMGMAARAASGAMSLRFDLDGSYVPIISDEDQRSETQSRARTSAFATGAAMVMLMFASWLLLGAFRVHNTTLFLLLFTLGSTMTLVKMGISLADRDVSELGDRLERLDRSLSSEVGRLDASATTDWRDAALITSLDVPGEELMRLRRQRVAAAQVIEAARYDLSRFPELLFASRVPDALLQPPALSSEDDALRTPVEAPAAMPGIWGWLLVIALLAAMLASTRAGLRAVKLKRLMEHMPTSPIRGVNYGLTEICGQPSQLSGTDELRGPVSNRLCLYYNYVVTRKSGDKTVTEKNITEHTPFLLTDASDSVVVHPREATFYTDHSVSTREGSRTYTERAIYLEDALYVLGFAGISGDAHDHLEVLHREDLPLVIAALPERELHYRVGRKGNFLLGLGVALTASLGMYTFTSFGTFGAGDYFYATLTSCLYTAACFVALLYNDLVFVRERVRRGFANIEVALKKRFDLIAALLPVVESYVAHERETLEAIAELRSHAPAEGPSREAIAQTSTDLGASNQASAALFALRESYPHLQADTHINALMRTLTDVEDELALMRAGYNDTVEHYNTRITTLPEIFIARPFGFAPAMHLDATVARMSPAPDMSALTTHDRAKAQAP